MKRIDRPRIMFIGPLRAGQTSLQRMEALQDLGCKTTPFDTAPYILAGNAH